MGASPSSHSIVGLGRAEGRGHGFPDWSLCSHICPHFKTMTVHWPRVVLKAESVVRLIDSYSDFGCPPDLESRHAWIGLICCSLANRHQKSPLVTLLPCKLILDGMIWPYRWCCMLVWVCLYGCQAELNGIWPTADVKYLMNRQQQPACPANPKGFSGEWGEYSELESARPPDRLFQDSSFVEVTDSLSWNTANWEFRGS